MARSRAPGKVVISGAYAVLEGAPALVAAVDRYVLADTARPAPLLTPEVAAAIGSARAPYFDASELRSGEQKLGLGSSAAILVASLAALELELEPTLTDAALGERLFARAVDAHARAQGGGSGIDVAASCYGGLLLARRSGGALEVQPRVWPSGLAVTVWASTKPASTAGLLAKVRELAERDPARHRRLLQAQADASEAAARALGDTASQPLLDALNRQREVLDELGQAAGAEIVTTAVRQLAELGQRDGAAVLPSGAGGGDIMLHVAPEPPSAAWQRLAANLEHVAVPLGLGARGVHAA